MRNRLAVLLLIVLIPTVIIIDQTVGNTFKGLRLILVAAVIGWLLGSVIVKTMERSNIVSGFMEFDVGGVRGLLISIVTSLVIILCGVVNSSLYLDDPSFVDTEIVAKESDIGGREGSNWILVVKADDYGQLSLRARHAFWDSVSVGDRLELKVRKSLVGFHVVIGF